MNWEFIVALIIAIPVVLVPLAFTWYLDAGGLMAAVKRVAKRTAHLEEAR